MAQQRAEILTPWEEITESDPEFGNSISRYPLVSSEYPLQRWQDITGQDAANLVPEPNLFSVLVVADETVIADVAADERFWVLWEEYI